MRKILLSIGMVLLASFQLVAQNQRVSGTVTDQEGQSLAGVVVLQQGTQNSALTAATGEYSINVPTNATLVFSLLGMAAQEIEVDSRTIVDVQMASAAEIMDDIIVIGYGTVRKSDFTGSASTLGAEKIANRPITNVTAALEGNVPGLRVTSSSGQPGSESNIRIRGIGSYSSSNAPVYVVDGSIFNGTLSSINPADIESVSILKDAQSTAIYGSSAGNGVILVTTKKGSSERGSITFSTSQGVSYMAYDDYARVGINDWLPLQWQKIKHAQMSTAWVNSQGYNGGKWGDEAAAAAYATKNLVGNVRMNPFVGVDNAELVSTDGLLNPAAGELKWGDDLGWYNAAYRMGHRQEYNLSFNSRTANSDTYASFGYLDQTGYMIGSGYKRYSARINYNMSPKKWIKTGLNLTYANSSSLFNTAGDTDNSSNYGNLVRFTRMVAPIYPLHVHDNATGAYLDADGNPTTDPSKYVYDYKSKRPGSEGSRHPIYEYSEDDRRTVINSPGARAYVTLNLLKGLSATARYGIDYRDSRQTVYRNAFVGDGVPGDLSNTSTRAMDQTFTQQVDYRNSWGDHNFNATAGHENSAYRYEYLYGHKDREVVHGIYEAVNFASIAELTGYTNNYRKESYFARADYNYAGKYYLGATYRRDGSSRFRKDNRWGNFWSAGASWRISAEEFMKKATWVNNLRLRASYGQTGVDSGVGYYGYRNLYDLAANNNTEPGIFYNSISIPGVRWETQITADVGIEFTLFDKLSGTVEYFDKGSKNLLFNVPVGTSNGVSSRLNNAGTMSNRGIEIDLKYNVIDGDTWRVNVGANATFIKNKMVRLPEENRAAGIASGSFRRMEGRSVYDYWTYLWWGVNPDDGNGLFILDLDKYDPTGNDPKKAVNATVRRTIVEKDGTWLTYNYSNAKRDFVGKSAIPKVNGGFSFNVGWKNIDLTANFSYQLGGYMMDGGYRDLMNATSGYYAMHVDQLKAWKKPGDITDVPRIDSNTSFTAHQTSSRFLVSTDMLNLSSMILSYRLPEGWMKKIGASNGLISCSGENLFMLKARQGINPIANFTGTTYNEYMPARIVSVALNLTF